MAVSMIYGIILVSHKQYIMCSLWVYSHCFKKCGFYHRSERVNSWVELVLSNGNKKWYQLKSLQSANVRKGRFCLYSQSNELWTTKHKWTLITRKSLNKLSHDTTGKWVNHNKTAYYKFYTLTSAQTVIHTHLDWPYWLWLPRHVFSSIFWFPCPSVHASRVWVTIDTLFSVKHLEVSLAYRMPCLRRDCVEQNSEKGLQAIKTNTINKDCCVNYLSCGSYMYQLVSVETELLTRLKVYSTEEISVAKLKTACISFNSYNINRQSH